MLACVHDPETDSGPRRAAAGLERLCVVTREVKPVADMIRFVVGPDGQVVADLKRRLPGRGVWVTASRGATAEAVKRRAFARGFKTDVRVASDLAHVVEGLLERSALDALSMTYKAGRVVAGFARVEGALAAEPVVALVHAADAGREGARKISAAARRLLGEGADRLAVVAAFTSAQLDLALGRPNVVHAALLAGPASDGFLARYRSLERFRTDSPGGRG
ncbi:MAG TPA: RNA-binding protein [Xanthobacteraceae bacterium]|nr:RNA-binding protein [Xanthobacteraceae bacterium]